MFLGTFFHGLDVKGRLIIPSDLRDAVSEEERKRGFVLTCGVDRCIFVFTQSDLEKVVAQVEEEFRGRYRDKPSEPRYKVRQFIRGFSSRARLRPLDSQGRVLVPDHLLEYAGIEKEVAIVGSLDRIELWNPEKWQGISSESEREYDDVAQEFF
jgi:MraZ protein